MRRSFASRMAAAALLGLALNVSAADQPSNDIAPAEKLLFMSPHLHGVDPHGHR